LQSPSGSAPSPSLHAKAKRAEAEALFRRSRIAFAVYGDEDRTERLIPFDIIPRIISAAEWRSLSAGIEQRVKALNAFRYDIYLRQETLRAGKIPADLIINNDAFVPEMMGVNPARGNYSHIIGVDIVRTGESEFCLLEDNTRTSSSRRHASSIFPHATSLDTLFSVSRGHRRPTTPGPRPGSMVSAGSVSMPPN
jgi:uncharacterized circularly permuted ATP-grasp superfamily protein